ncbi:hypothetical protein BGZ63DRAFT_381527 [Mariannaea sp. PMI_226]|nr:hypothetical protein BGZ63DRAFT_381527 [Mariannaea sp. PMI_226]
MHFSPALGLSSRLTLGTLTLILRYITRSRSEIQRDLLCTITRHRAFCFSLAMTPQSLLAYFVPSSPPGRRS